MPKIQQAEREGALVLRRPLVEEYWAWFEEILFAVRSRMTATAHYNLTAAGLLDQDIDLDADVFICCKRPRQALFLTSTTIFSFFYVFRLDGNEAEKRAVAIA